MNSNDFSKTFVWLIIPFFLTAQNTRMKTYGGAGLDEGVVVQPTNDTGYIITGYTSSFGAGNCDVYLIKTNSRGDTLWTKTYGGLGGESGSDVKQTSDGVYIIAGYTYSFGNGGADLWLVKTNASGDTIWTKTFGGPFGDYGSAVQQTSDGG